MTGAPRRPGAPPAGAPALRLFVALDLPAAPRAALARFRDAGADPAAWRALPDASLHVTLAFLGHRPAADVPRVEAVLTGLAHRSAVPLALGVALLLPPRRPRVLAVAVEDPRGVLGALRSEVAAGLVDAGVYALEARAFRPHVTVGRLRARASAPRSIAVAPEPVDFGAEAVTLYRSRLGRGGAAYEPLVTRRLV